jgi:CheY-like chemotaxis protein
VRRHVVGYEGARRTILVADDQEENRQLLRRMLEPLGFVVTLASNGREAVAAARERRPDLVVMDLRMPQMDGFEAAHAIRQTSELETVPVMAASASTADLEQAEADSRTFVACMRKPFQSSELIDAIQRILALEWRYAPADEAHTRRADQPASQQADAPLVSPPRAVVEELLELARLGKFVRVEQIALDLERQDALRPFAQRLYGLARRLDEDELLALLEGCLGDVVTE